MSVHGSVQAAIWQMVPLTKTLGILVEKAEPGFVKTSLIKNELVLNHMGMYHAVPLYALAEATITALYASSFDMSQADMISRSGSINYKKTVYEEASCTSRLDLGELERIKEQFAQSGRAQFTLNAQVLDQEEEIACEATFEILLRAPHQEKAHQTE